MEKIYISYANEDLSVAKSVKETLDANGISSCIIDHTEENLNGDVANEMLSGIKNCELFLCLYSKNSNASNFVSIEINAAVKREKKVYLINIDGVLIEKKTNFAIANSVILNGNLKKTLPEFISIVKGGNL